ENEEPDGGVTPPSRSAGLPLFRCLPAHEGAQDAVDELHRLRRLILLGDLHRLVDGGAVGDVRHVQNLIHGHPHDGGGHQGDPGKIPPLGVFGDIPVQLRSVVGHAPHQAADVVRLLGVGRLLIQRVLLRQGGEGLRCQALVQQLLHRLVGEAQLVGQMNGDLSRGVPYHNLNYVLFSLIPIRDSGQRHAAHVDVDRLHRAAGHGLHRADDGLLGIFRHRGDGVAVLHRQIDVQHQGGAGHVDLHTLGALLG
ncbi:putative HTH-type transcriptional regulator yurK, partial [Dysosmobacter welbionis]